VARSILLLSLSTLRYFIKWTDYFCWFVCFVRTVGLYKRRRVLVDSVSVNKFRDNLKYFVEQVINDHLPLKITRRAGEDFVIISAEDWARDQETLYVLQNNYLMRQIADSTVTCAEKTGYMPSEEELDEIVGV